MNRWVTKRSKNRVQHGSFSSERFITKFHVLLTNNLPPPPPKKKIQAEFNFLFLTANVFKSLCLAVPYRKNFKKTFRYKASSNRFRRSWTAHRLKYETCPKPFIGLTLIWLWERYLVPNKQLNSIRTFAKRGIKFHRQDRVKFILHQTINKLLAFKNCFIK